MKAATRGQTLLAAFMVGGAIGATSIVACTPAQRAPARTAIEASRCVHEIALRYIDAGVDFRDPAVLTNLGVEIASECNPLEKASQ